MVSKIQQAVEYPFHGYYDPRSGANGDGASGQQNEGGDFDESRDGVVGKVDGVKAALGGEAGASDSGGAAPQRLRRPSLSMRKKSQMTVTVALTTPKTPVVRRLVFVPVTPIDLKTVGE